MIQSLQNLNEYHVSLRMISCGMLLHNPFLRFELKQFISVASYVLLLDFLLSYIFRLLVILTFYIPHK